jgi:DNA replication initiation complex subunit (GINS family)
LRVEEQTIQVLRQLLEAEEQSEHPTKLPADTYSRIATYVQKLRRGSDITADDPLSRLTRKQLWLLEGMGRQLLDRRIAKALSRHDVRDLLPEEKFVCEFYMEFERMRGRFVKAMANGQQSVFTILQKDQMRKMVTVRFQKPLAEVVGFDLNRYGPFRVHDVAEIPAANAEVMISNGDATIVHTKDSI